MLYLKVKSYQLKKFGNPQAFVILKVHPFTMKLKAKITLQNGKEFTVKSQRASEEEFEWEIERIINEQMYSQS